MKQQIRKKKCFLTHHRQIQIRRSSHHSFFSSFVSCRRRHRFCHTFSFFSPLVSCQPVRIFLSALPRSPARALRLRPNKRTDFRPPKFETRCRRGSRVRSPGKTTATLTSSGSSVEPTAAEKLYRERLDTVELITLSYTKTNIFYTSLRRIFSITHKNDRSRVFQSIVCYAIKRIYSSARLFVLYPLIFLLC